jgi:hypothetical protein
VARRRCPNLELLEDRTSPAVFGQPWAMPTHLTLSFAPDGTPIDGRPSDLFQTLDATQPTASWQQTILEAAQAWASRANLGVGLVSDGGQPFGTPGSIQGDLRFGDIRIGAEAIGQDSSAISFPPDPYFGGTLSGDIILNDSVVANASPSDLSAIVLHELGHTLGLPDSTDPVSVMSEQPSQPLGELGPADVSAIQALYGAPPSALAGNSTIATALPIATPQQFGGSTPVVAYGAIDGAQPTVVYSFSPPSGYQGTATVRLVTSGLSLLDPSVSVFDASGNLLGSAASTKLGGDTLSSSLGAASPGNTFYVEIQAAAPGPFDSGRFGLAVTFKGSEKVSASQIDSLLRGPYEALTADQIARKFQESEDFSAGGQVPGYQLATALPLTTTSGFALDTRFQAVAPMRNMPERGYYSLQAPAATGGGALILTVGLNAAGLRANSGRVVVLDASGNVVPSSVLMRAGGVDTIQAIGLTPGATYFLRVSLPDDASDDGGGGGTSVLVADFLQPSGLQTGLENNTLSAAIPQATSTLYVARTQFFQFQLSGTSAQSDGGGAIRMTVLDQGGNTVLDLTTMDGQYAAVSSVLLIPGQYSVEFSILAGGGDALPAVGYAVQGGALSDPIGPIVHNPTYKPIYLSPPGSKAPYLYPNGRFSAIPYLWVYL